MTLTITIGLHSLKTLPINCKYMHLPQWHSGTQKWQDRGTDCGKEQYEEFPTACHQNRSPTCDRTCTFQIQASHSQPWAWDSWCVQQWFAASTHHYNAQAPTAAEKARMKQPLSICHLFELPPTEHQILRGSNKCHDSWRNQWWVSFPAMGVSKGKTKRDSLIIKFLDNNICFSLILPFSFLILIET